MRLKESERRKSNSVQRDEGESIGLPIEEYGYTKENERKYCTDCIIKIKAGNCKYLEMQRKKQVDERK